MEGTQIDLTPGKSLDERLENILSRYETVLDFTELEKILPSQRWIEIHPDMDDFKILHLFEQENEYMVSKNGNISKGQWKVSLQSEVIILDITDESGKTISQLYELAYADENYIFLKKHGEQRRYDQRKFLALGEESVVKDQDLEDIIEELDKSEGSQFKDITMIIGIVLILILIFYIFVK